MIDHRNKFEFVDVEQRRQLIDMFPQTDEVKKRAVQTPQRMWRR